MKTWVTGLVVASAMSFAAAGCSSDSSSSSSGSTGGGSTTGTTGTSSSGSTGTSGSSGSSGTSGTQSLYQKYGEDAGVWDVVTTAVGGVISDPNEAPYFADVIANASDTNPTGKGSNGADTPTRLESCLQYQLSLALGAPGGLAAYPPATTDPRGFACQDMSSVHANVGVPNGTFDIFVLDAASVLAAKGVQQQDIATIGGVLTSLRGNIVSAQPRFFYCGDGGPVASTDVPANFDGGCL